MSVTNKDIVAEIVRTSTDEMDAEGFDAIVDLLDKKDAEIAMLTAELEARRLVMGEQERVAAMPRAYSAGG